MCSHFGATDRKNEYDYIEQMKDINHYKVRRQGRLIYIYSRGRDTNQNMITLLVNVLEHSESRTASRFTWSIPRILTTLDDTQNETRQIVHYISSLQT